MNKELIWDMAYDMAKDIVRATCNPSRTLDDEQWFFVVWKWCRCFLENYEARANRLEKLLGPSRN